jgi:predicted  nucleic acid-binding Zn-ribbon protein
MEKKKAADHYAKSVVSNSTYREYLVNAFLKGVDYAEDNLEELRRELYQAKDRIRELEGVIDEKENVITELIER